MSGRLGASYEDAYPIVGAIRISMLALHRHQRSPRSRLEQQRVRVGDCRLGRSNMPSQDEFLASLLQSREAMRVDHTNAHGARILRERMSQDLYDNAQLLNAEAHEAAIVKQQQQLRLSKSLPCILKPHDIFEPVESDDEEHEGYQESEAEELAFSKEEIACCIALAHAGSGRDSAVSLEDEDGPDYIYALAAVLETGLPDEEVSQEHYGIHAPEHDATEGNVQEEDIMSETDFLDSEPEERSSESETEEEPSSASTEDSGVGTELQLKVTALKVRLMSALDWRLTSIDNEGLKEIANGCDPLITELERLVSAVKMQAQHLIKRREATRIKIVVEDEYGALQALQEP